MQHDVDNLKRSLHTSDLTADRSGDANRVRSASTPGERFHESDDFQYAACDTRGYAANQGENLRRSSSVRFDDTEKMRDLHELHQSLRDLRSETAMLRQEFVTSAGKER